MFIHSEIAAGTLSEDPFPYCSCEHCIVLNDKPMMEFEQDVMGQMPKETYETTSTMASVPETTTTTTTTMPTKIIRNNATFYSCSVCNKSTFKTQHRLMKHMRIHNNEQPFQCEICQKVYNASSSLKSHQRMAHNMNNNNSGNGIDTASVNNQASLTCTICNKSFLKSCHLTVHMKTVHNNERQYACQYCSYRFSMQSKLSAHIRQAHSNVETLTPPTALTTSEEIIIPDALTSSSSLDQHTDAVTTTLSDSVAME